MNGGFGKIPASGGLHHQNKKTSHNTQSVKIISLPESLEKNNRTVRLEGPVTQTNSNGTARIQTERGAITVQFQENQQPHKGQRVEISIPAGRPPKNATIQQEHVPVKAQPRSQQTKPPTTTSGQIPTSSPPKKAATLPPHTSLQPKAITPATFTPAPLIAGHVARLVYVLPTQAQQILQANTPLEIIPHKASASANGTLSSAINQLQIIESNQSFNFQSKSLLSLSPSSFIQQPQSFFSNHGHQKNISFPHMLNTKFFSEIKIPAFNIALLPSIQSKTQNMPLSHGFALKIVAGTTAVLPLNSPALHNPETSSLQAKPLTNITSSLTVKIATTPAKQIDMHILQIRSPEVILDPPKNISALPAPTSFDNSINSKTNTTNAFLSPNTATSVTATVLGFTPQKQPLVSVQLPGLTHAQNFILQFTPNNITPGAQLQIQLSNIPPIRQPAVTATPIPSLTSLLQGFQWSAFDDLIQTYLQQGPQASQNLIRSLPNLANPTQLSAAGMMFVAAIRSGDFSALLSERRIDMLQRSGRSDILSRLTQDRTTTRSEAASTSEWRAIPLPMFWENEIHKITLFMRREQDSQSQKDSENGQTRFIFDLNLTRMGDIQIDGLLQDKRLDLILRSQMSLSKSMQHHMRQLYKNALDQSDMTGDLTFQGNTTHWVHVIKEQEQVGVSV